MKLRTLVAMGLLLLALAGFQHWAGHDSDTVTIRIAHTNDIHGQALPMKAVWRTDFAEPPLVGGFAATGAMIEAQRALAARSGESFLYLDAGDIWQGTPEGNLTEGALVTEWFNAVGLDALAIGNHEFDAGADRVGPILAPIQGAVLSANLVGETSGRVPDFAEPFIDREIDGVQVTVIGLTAENTKRMATRRATEGFAFRSALQVAKEHVFAARERGAEVVILLSHCGHEVDLELAAIPGVDLIIGGHSHQFMHHIDRNTGALVHATYGKTTQLGVVTLAVDRKTRRVVNKTATASDVLVAAQPAHGPSAELIARYRPRIEAIMGEVLGQAKEAVRRQRGFDSSPMGNWVTDVIREASGADVGLTNKTGLRADIEAGPVRVRECFQVSPFGNTVVQVTLTGAELQRAFEFALTESRRGFEVSGATIRYERPASDPANPAQHRPARLVSFQVGDKPLDPSATYTVATNSFLAQGGDGHGVLDTSRGRKDTGLSIF
ncbi:MAG: bifunctional metallophosphatase/5'-nucleotidase, partial [Planctomycetota bacterium]